MVELRHPAVAALQRPHEVAHRVEAHPVPVRDRLQAGDVIDPAPIDEARLRGRFGLAHPRHGRIQ